MGQWIQEGERSIFETVISLDKVDHKLEVPSDEANLDGLNFLAGKRVDEVNKMAELGTQLAHVDGGVPNMRIVLPSLSEYNIGSLLYFFEKACGISGYLLGVNPAGCRSIQEEHVCVAEQTGLRGRIQSDPIKIVIESIHKKEAVLLRPLLFYVVYRHSVLNLPPLPLWFSSRFPLVRLHIQPWRKDRKPTSHHRSYLHVQ